MKIGVISDTHNFLDPKIAKLFAGVEHILHGGDIGLPWVILELEAIAPVTAVLGNTDDGRLQFKETEVVELAGRNFFVHHIINPYGPAPELPLTPTLSPSNGKREKEPDRRREKTRIEPARNVPDVVVFGHTHKPYCETIGRTFFFNPGYAGKSRFGMPRTVAILHCDAKTIRPEFLPL
jgi:uncharacterized protein